MKPAQTTCLSSEQFCRAYWHPLYAYLRRGGYGGANGSAWAVINHNSYFAVADISAIPEPGSTATLILLLATALNFPRRRSQFFAA